MKKGSLRSKMALLVAVLFVSVQITPPTQGMGFVTGAAGAATVTTISTLLSTFFGAVNGVVSCTFSGSKKCHLFRAVLISAAVALIVGVFFKREAGIKQPELYEKDETASQVIEPVQLVPAQLAPIQMGEQEALGNFFSGSVDRVKLRALFNHLINLNLTTQQVGDYIRKNLASFEFSDDSARDYAYTAFVKITRPFLDKNTFNLIVQTEAYQRAE